MKNLIAPCWDCNNFKPLKYLKLYSMNFSKSFVAVLSTTILLAACGGGSETKPAEAPKDTAASAPASTAGGKGLELSGASDCTTCHRLSKESSGASIGPAYSEVAAKYSPAADTTIDR